MGVGKQGKNLPYLVEKDWFHVTAGRSGPVQYYILFRLFSDYGYHFEMYFNSCWENLNQSSFNPFCEGSWLLSHPLILGSSTNDLTENCLQCQKWSPYKMKEALSKLVCVATKRQPKSFFLLPAKTATMCTACLNLPNPPFLLAWTYPPTPTDNMRPKLDYSTLVINV